MPLVQWRSPLFIRLLRANLHNACQLLHALRDARLDRPALRNQSVRYLILKSSMQQ